MEPDAMILVFWMLSFKPTFSLSCFTFFKVLFSSSFFLPSGWCHLDIWGHWYFSRKSWFQLVLHPAQHFTWWSCLSLLKYKPRTVVHSSSRSYLDTVKLDGVWHRRFLTGVHFSVTISPSTSILLFSPQKARWVTTEHWIPGPCFRLFLSIFQSLMPCNFSVSSTKSRVCTFAK